MTRELHVLARIGDGADGMELGNSHCDLVGNLVRLTTSHMSHHVSE